MNDNPRVLKVGTSTFTTPQQLAIASKQFFAPRSTRGAIILDARQITHARGGIIPLATIRDLSIGRYPRTMAPAGIDVLSVTYEENGESKQVLLSPIVGWLRLPSTVNSLVAEWFTAIRDGVTAATGRAPGQTPAVDLGVPGSHNLIVPVLFTPIIALGLCIFALLSFSPESLTSSFGLLVTFIWVMMSLGVSVVYFRATRAVPDRSVVKSENAN